MRYQEEKTRNSTKNVVLEREEYGYQEKILDFDKDEGELDITKGFLGSPRSILKGVGNLKQQMQFIVKEVEQVSKLARGERTLGQHIDRLSEVIGHAKEFRDLMKKITQIEAKNRVLEKANSDNQKKVTRLEAKLNNIEKMIKQMVDNNSNSLKTMADNVSTLLKKLEQEKGQDTPSVVENQGPTK